MLAVLPTRRSCHFIDLLYVSLRGVHPEESSRKGKEGGFVSCRMSATRISCGLQQLFPQLHSIASLLLTMPSDFSLCHNVILLHSLVCTFVW